MGNTRDPVNINTYKLEAPVCSIIGPCTSGNNRGHCEKITLKVPILEVRIEAPVLKLTLTAPALEVTIKNPILDVKKAPFTRVKP